MAAFDVEEDGEQFEVGVQVANPLGAGGEEVGVGVEKEHIWVVDATGQTVYEAVQNLEILSTRKLDWSHVEVMLLSEELARRGIRPVLDYLDRERQARLITRPLVVEGDLRKLLEMEFPLEVLGGDALSKHLLHVQEVRATVSEVDSTRLLFHHLSLPGREVLLPLGGVELEEEESQQAAEEGGMETGTVSLAGGAVFYRDRLVGFMNDSQTSGYLWVTDNLERASIVLVCPCCEEEKVTVEVFKAESEKQIAAFTAGEPSRFSLYVEADSRIQDFACPELLLEEEFFSEINRRTAEVIRDEIKESLDKARELESDVFGLGNLVYRKEPRIWNDMEKDWVEIFPEVKVEVEVEVTTRRHGQVTDPVKIN